MTHDDLDCALLGLPLEEPPRELRAAILAATVYAAPLALGFWETVTIGALLAVATWLCIAASLGADMGAAFGWFVNELSGHGAPLWLTAGCAIALLISLLNIDGRSRARLRVVR